MAGRRIFVAGEILTAANVQSFLQDQAVMVFDDDTARGSAIPSPVEGMVTYRKDANLVEAFTGSAFTPVGRILQILETQKTTSFTTASTSLVDVTDLEVTITPSSSSSKFLILLHGLRVSNSGTPGSVSMGVARDATDIGQVAAHQDNTANIAGNVSVTVLDSPATGSAITYKGRAQAAVGTATVLRSYITVLEFAS